MSELFTRNGVPGDETLNRLLLSMQDTSRYLSQLTFIPTTTDYEGIIAALAAALAAGGGKVKLLPVTYNIGSNSLPIYSNIVYEGSGWNITSYSGIPDAYNPSGISGTVINGDGTNVGISGNTISNGSQYSTQTLFSNAALTHICVHGIAFTNVTQGIQIGSNWTPGAFYSSFTDLLCVGASLWGFWFENNIHNFYDRIYAFGCGTGATSTQQAGGVQFRSSCGSVFQPANCRIGEIVSTAPLNLLARGIEVSTINGTAGSGLSQISIIQSNRFNNPTFNGGNAVTATSVGGGSANLTLSGTGINTNKLQVGMPIAFSSTNLSGITANQIYVVQAIVDSTNIKIANYTYASAINFATASQTGTLVCQGFAPINFIADSTSTTNGGLATVIDSEAGGTAKLYIENCTPSTSFTCNNIGRDSSSTVDICLRNSPHLIMFSNNLLIYDLDGESSSSIIIGSATSGGWPNYRSIVLGYDGGLGGNVLGMSGQGASFLNKKPQFGDFTYPNQVIGERIFYSTSTALHFAMGLNVGFSVYTGSGAAEWAWNQGGFNSGALVGMKQSYKNAGTGALTVRLEVNNSNSGTFDGLSGYSQAATTSGSTTIAVAATGSLAVGGIVQFSGITTAVELSASTDYFIKTIVANTSVTVATSPAGSAISVTLQASGLTMASQARSIVLVAPASATSATQPVSGGELTMVCAQIGASSYQWEIESMSNATLV